MLVWKVEKNPQQQNEVRHLAARAQRHARPRSTRPVSDASLHVSTLVCLTALLTSLQLARPNHPSTFPSHVDWCMDASMRGSLVPTHTNDAPRHPTARMKHHPSPLALMDGTGLLQMRLQRAESSETMQDNWSNWDHSSSSSSRL